MHSYTNEFIKTISALKYFNNARCRLLVTCRGPVRHHMLTFVLLKNLHTKKNIKFNFKIFILHNRKRSYKCAQ